MLAFQWSSLSSSLGMASWCPGTAQELASSLGHDPAITFDTYKSDLDAAVAKLLWITLVHVVVGGKCVTSGISH